MSSYRRLCQFTLQDILIAMTVIGIILAVAPWQVIATWACFTLAAIVMTAHKTTRLQFGIRTALFVLTFVSLSGVLCGRMLMYPGSPQPRSIFFATLLSSFI